MLNDPYELGGGDDDLDDLLADLDDDDKSTPAKPAQESVCVSPSEVVAPELPPVRASAELAPAGDADMLNYIDDFAAEGETDVFHQKPVATAGPGVAAVHHDEWLEVCGAPLVILVFVGRLIEEGRDNCLGSETGSAVP